MPADRSAASPLYCISCGKPVEGDWCPEPCHTDLRDSNNRVTRWGETMDDLADALLADKSAPPVLLLAAFLHKRGAPGRLRSLIGSALALEMT